MGTANADPATSQLEDLNKRMVVLEQSQGKAAVDFYTELLSDRLMFRRANGDVVGKSGPGGFLEGLQKPGPFTSRTPEDISVTIQGDRALVTLIVVAGRADGTSGRYRNIRYFSRAGEGWMLELWYNYDLAKA